MQGQLAVVCVHFYISYVLAMVLALSGFVPSQILFQSGSQTYVLLACLSGAPSTHTCNVQKLKYSIYVSDHIIKPVLSNRLIVFFTFCELNVMKSVLIDSNLQLSIHWCFLV